MVGSLMLILGERPKLGAMAGEANGSFLVFRLVLLRRLLGVGLRDGDDKSCWDGTSGAMGKMASGKLGI